MEEVIERIEDIYKDKTRMIPNFKDIQNAATKFSDSHRYVLQKLLLNPSVTINIFNIWFIEHYVTVELNVHPCVVKYISAASEQLRSLSNVITKTINDENKRNNHELSMGMHIAIVSSECSAVEYVALTCELQNSEIISAHSDISNPEKKFYLSTIDRILKNDGEIDKELILNEEIDPSLNNYNVLDKLMSEKWFSHNSYRGTIEIGPRTVAELDVFIRYNYKDFIEICQYCSNIIIRKSLAVKCNSCESYIHFNCFKRACKPNYSCDCNCKNKINYEEVQPKINKIILTDYGRNFEEGC